MGIAYNTSIVRDGLVLYLDAANQKSYSGSGTVWKDLSGNGNDGTLVNGTSYSTDNKGSMVFDGTNSYVETNFGNGRNPSTDPISYSCWVIKNDTANDMFLVQGHWGSAARAYFGVNAGKWGIGIQDSGWEANGSVFNSTTWYFTTIVFDGSDCKLYINGNYDCQKSYTSFVFNQTLQLGSTSYDYQYTWNGKISNLSVYDRALTELEIRQNFEALRGRYGI